MSEMDMKNKEPVFVIGFPKSGNTWLARLLAEATYSNINAVDAINAADNSSDRSGRYLIYKEHVVQDIDRVLQGKVVYIVRDPRDVFVSGFFHCNRWCTDTLIKSNLFYKLYFRREIKKLNKKWQGNPMAEINAVVKAIARGLIGRGFNKVEFGNWSAHVDFWSKHLSVTVVRYEDLLHDTKGELKRLLDELKIETSLEKIKESVENQSFKKKKDVFLKNGDSKNAKFLRSGKSGGWRDLLSSSMVKEIEKTHADEMTRCGYELEYYRPVK